MLALLEYLGTICNFIHVTVSSNVLFFTFADLLLCSSISSSQSCHYKNSSWLESLSLLPSFPLPLFFPWYLCDNAAAGNRGSLEQKSVKRYSGGTLTTLKPSGALSSAKAHSSSNTGIVFCYIFITAPNLPLLSSLGPVVRDNYITLFFPNCWMDYLKATIKKKEFDSLLGNFSWSLEYPWFSSAECLKWCY